jgi:hypothetical protein
LIDPNEERHTERSFGARDSPGHADRHGVQQFNETDVWTREDLVIEAEVESHQGRLADPNIGIVSLFIA